MTTEQACTFEACVDAEQVGCNRGKLLEDCEYWKGKPSSDPMTGVAVSADGTAASRLLRLPWTGNSFGLRDAGFTTACNVTTLTGLVGPHGSGKTTLLALMYLMLQHGGQLSTGTFAGSASLIGWENLANKLRWTSGKDGPTFPPHTSRSAGRCPGLLHLGFRTTDNTRRDFLLTDPPGEWFGVWAQRSQGPGTQGARWIHEYADRFLLLADRQALASSERGKARDHLRDLARRLSQGLRQRPIAVVWTKADVEIPATIEEDLRECFANEFPGHAEFRLQMRFGNESSSKVEDPCLAMMEWVFSPPKRSRAKLDLPVHRNSDNFLAFRGR